MDRCLLLHLACLARAQEKGHPIRLHSELRQLGRRDLPPGDPGDSAGGLKATFSASMGVGAR